MATATVISYPDNQINLSLTINDSLNSYDLLQYIWVELATATTDTYVEIVYNSVTTTLNIVDECRYTPVDIFFNNKEGGQQVLTFFKTQTESLKTSEENYESDSGQPSEGYHQFIRYNVQGKKSFKASSGFVDESMNDIFEELLFAENVWKYDGTNMIPLNVSTKSLDYKTRQNDRLINYEIKFDYAYNELNSI